MSAQTTDSVEARPQCACGKKRSIKDWKLRRIHTAFGRLYLPSPRVIICTCDSSQRRAISPLKVWLTRPNGELRYLAGLKRRLGVFVSRLHISSERLIALMTDGAESLLRRGAYLQAPRRFVLDYFHVSMKLRQIDQCIGAIPPMDLSSGESFFERYDRFNYRRGYLWSGRR